MKEITLEYCNEQKSTHYPKKLDDVVTKTDSKEFTVGEIKHSTEL